MVMISHSYRDRKTIVYNHNYDKCSHQGSPIHHQSNSCLKNMSPKNMIVKNMGLERMGLALNNLALLPNNPRLDNTPPPPKQLSLRLLYQ